MCSLRHLRCTSAPNSSPAASDRHSVGSESRLSGRDIRSNQIQVVARGFERLFGIMARKKPGVIVESHIALPPETIKDGQQPSMFLVDTCPHKIDDGDVVARLTSCTESMTEHESKGSLSIAS